MASIDAIKSNFLQINIEDSSIFGILEKAEAMASKYKNSTDLWKQGSIKSHYFPLIDKELPSYVMTFIPGLMGELAFQKFMVSNNLPDFPVTNFDVLTEGDAGSDFIYRNKKLQVKCSSRKLLDALLIKRYRGSVVPSLSEYEPEREIPILYDIAISCHHEIGTSIVTLQGFIKKEELEDKSIFYLDEARTRNANWLNIEVPIRKLHPIMNLVKDILPERPNAY